MFDLFQSFIHADHDHMHDFCHASFPQTMERVSVGCNYYVCQSRIQREYRPIPSIGDLSPPAYLCFGGGCSF